MPLNSEPMVRHVTSDHSTPANFTKRPRIVDALIRHKNVPRMTVDRQCRIVEGQDRGDP
jgi:hypothetical protein